MIKYLGTASLISVLLLTGCNQDESKEKNKESTSKFTQEKSTKEKPKENTYSNETQSVEPIANQSSETMNQNMNETNALPNNSNATTSIPNNTNETSHTSLPNRDAMFAMPGTEDSNASEAQREWEAQRAQDLSQSEGNYNENWSAADQAHAEYETLKSGHPGMANDTSVPMEPFPDIEKD
ncbi:hypothetical protein GJU84_11120 [Staphylococcus chromogenes]|uniref:hypothetical protein n=1 Tax=Staphylococcus chromogenes TaxID=46126 RepID=UPI001404EB85|nr:hypothetical protein [Staphylococcus chromogenes]QIN27563.1 hypothetical protein GJU84_11120 [Staphylococcus chromogenes]